MNEERIEPFVSNEATEFLNAARETAMTLSGGLGSITYTSPVETMMDAHFQFVAIIGKAELYSLAQYARQEINGDLMRDPDIEILRTATGQWFSWSFRNDFVGIDQQFVSLDESGLPIRINLKGISSCNSTLEKIIETIADYPTNVPMLAV